MRECYRAATISRSHQMDGVMAQVQAAPPGAAWCIIAVFQDHQGS